jgi:hypothetical protein
MVAETTFDATQDTLENLLREIGQGKIQLPDFQRGWVWDDVHIRSVVTSVSRSFPIGAVMTLQTGGYVKFQPRVIEGIEFEGAVPVPERLILDGQQRLTSLYQALMLPRAIATRDEKNKQVDRWYYVRSDNLQGMMAARAQVLCEEISRSTGRPVGGPKITELMNGNQPFDSQMDDPDDE